MMSKYFHFTLTSDAKRKIPKMYLDSLVEEYLWQEEEYRQGASSIKQKSKRIRQLIEVEVARRNTGPHFEKLLRTKTQMAQEHTG